MDQDLQMMQDFIAQVEKIAFSIPAPNQHVPLLIGACIAARNYTLIRQAELSNERNRED